MFPLDRISTRRFWIGLTLVSTAIALAVYWRSLHVGFLSDDYDFFLFNSTVHDAHSFFALLWIKGGVWRPLVQLTFTIQHWLFGMHAIAYHAFSLGLHVAVAMGVAVLAWNLFRQRWVSVLAAVLFIIWPANQEITSWISGFGDALATALGVWSLVFLSFSSRRRSSRIIGWGLFTLSLLTKEDFLMLPLLWAIIVWWKASSPYRERWRLVAREVWVGCGLALAFLITRSIHAGKIISGNKLYGVDSKFTLSPVRLLVPVVDYLRSIIHHVPSFTSVFRSASPTAIVLGILAIAGVALVGFQHHNWKDRKTWGIVVLFCLLLIALNLPYHVLLKSVSSDLSQTRYLYAGTAVFILGLAWLLGMPGRTTRQSRFTLFLLIPLFTALVWANVVNAQPWVRAGHAHDAILTSIRQEFPELQANPRGFILYVFGVPDNLDGAFLFRNGFSMAVRLRLNQLQLYLGQGTERVVRVIDSGITADRACAPSRVTGTPLLANWDGTKLTRLALPIRTPATLPAAFTVSQNGTSATATLQNDRFFGVLDGSIKANSSSGIRSLATLSWNAYGHGYSVIFPLPTGQTDFTLNLAPCPIWTMTVPSSAVRVDFYERNHSEVFTNAKLR